VIDAFELRSNPALALELRDHPGENIERRFVGATVEVRAKDEGGYRMLGHAAVFGDLSENLGGFRERIERGAFHKVLAASPDVRALFNHDPNLVLARTHAGTLSLDEDPKGLAYDADVASTSYASDLRVLLERGDVSQSSFAFRVADDSWTEDPETGGLIRTIHEYAALYDVSPVTYPAYPTTDAGLRDLNQLDGEGLRDLAWKIHRGEKQATGEERAAIDALLAADSTVSPWEAQRALMAVASEPELLGAIPEKRATVGLEDVAGEPSWKAAARQRSLRLHELELVP
jgi:HK97 family phage prohead protease